MLTLSHTIERAGDRPLLVGFSGGLDSTVLLHLLASLGRPGLRAIHVDHGLHAHAREWVAHCTMTCASLDVPLTTVHVDVNRSSTLGLEGASRAARHAAFQANLDNDEVLALAHHRDDQAETFLLRALRASGPDGLASMRPWRPFGRGWLWRPLLGTPRTTLLDHAQQHGLRWIEDASNTNDAFDRNFLRHRVLPVLRDRWPDVEATFARSAALSAEASELLENEDARALDGVIHAGGQRCIEVSRFRALDAARRARVLRRWIGGLGLPPLPARGVAAVQSDLLGSAPAGVPQFAWAGASIHRWRDLLHAGWDQPPLPLDWQATWDGRAAMRLPNGGTLQLRGCDRFDTAVSVGARRGGERIRLSGRSHSHALKHVLQDLGVPPWERARLPLLTTVQGDVLAAGDRVYSGAFETWLREREARLGWSAD